MSSDPLGSSPLSPVPSSVSPIVGDKRPARTEEPSPSPTAVLDGSTALWHYANPLQEPPSPSPAPGTVSSLRSKRARSAATTAGSQGNLLGILTMRSHIPANLGEEPHERVEFVSPVQQAESQPRPDFTGKQPEPAHRVALEESPKVRIPWGASIITQAKNYVRAVDPNSGDCLLTGKDATEEASQFAHIVPRATKPDALTVLEWKWGMPYYSLYIDTRFNILLLRVDWHVLCDKGLWALVPHFEIIRKILHWVIRCAKDDKQHPISKLWADYTDESNPSTSKPIASTSQPHASTSQSVTQAGGEETLLPIYRYYMLPLGDKLTTTLLHRRHRSAGDATQHSYPYEALGELRSHVQPHYVVYALGAKLAAQEKILGDSFDDWLAVVAKHASLGYDTAAGAGGKNYERLREVMQIFRAWAPSQLLEVPKKFQSKKGTTLFV